MGKWVVLSFSILIAFCEAANADTRQCQFIPYNTSNKPEFYINTKGQVNCVNYGGNKIVEYIYNDSDHVFDWDFYIHILGQQTVKKTYTYALNSLIGKRFYNFETAKPIEIDPRAYPDAEFAYDAMTRRFLYPATSDYFETGVVEEELLKIKNIKKLADVIKEYFPKPKDQEKFVNNLAKYFYSKIEIETPASFAKASFEKKLEFIFNPPVQKRLTTAKKEARERRVELTRVSLENEIKIRANLIQRNAKNMNLNECNPALDDYIRGVFVRGEGFQTDSPNLDNFGFSQIQNDEIYMFLSTELFDSYHDYTISELDDELTLENAPGLEKFIKYRYPIRVKDKAINMYPNLSLVTWVLVREMGKINLQSILTKNEKLHYIKQIMPELSFMLADPNDFEIVPKDLKNKIKTEITEPLRTIYENATEAYMIDAIPCLL